MVPDGGLWGLVPPEASELACQTLGDMQRGAIVDMERHGRIMREFYRGWWRLLTGRTLPPWQDGRGVLYSRSLGTEAKFTVAEVTPLVAAEYPVAGMA